MDATIPATLFSVGIVRWTENLLPKPIILSWNRFSRAIKRRMKCIFALNTFSGGEWSASFGGGQSTIFFPYIKYDVDDKFATVFIFGKVLT